MNPAMWGVGEWLGVIALVTTMLSTFAGAVAWCVNTNGKLNRIGLGVDKINGQVGRHAKKLERHDWRLRLIEGQSGMTCHEEHDDHDESK